MASGGNSKTAVAANTAEFDIRFFSYNRRTGRNDVARLQAVAIPYSLFQGLQRVEGVEIFVELFPVN